MYKMFEAVKNLLAMRKTGFNPWIGKIPWRREWQSTVIFLPGEFREHRLQSMGSQRVRQDWATNAFSLLLHYFHGECPSWQELFPLFILCLVTQLCLAFCDPLDYSLPSSSVHGIFQARILEWVATSSSRGLNWYLLCIRHCRQIIYLLSYQGNPLFILHIYM